MKLRAQALASWHTASRVTSVKLGAVLNRASAAGMLLDLADNDASEAIRRTPHDSPWWDGVRELLVRINEEEGQP